MYLLYLDESGNENDAADRHFVLAGLAIFERNTFFLSQALDEIQTRHFPGLPPIPFHLSEIRAGRNFWRKVEREKKQAVIAELSRAIAAAAQGMFLFGVAIEKSDKVWGETAVELATEHICRRFDSFLRWKYRAEDDPQRGLIIFSEGRFHTRARLWVQGFRERGTRWGALNNLSDIPYFANPRESRLLQAADAVAHAVFLLYEKRDGALLRDMLGRFQQGAGVLHGLVHLRTDTTAACGCPACVSRATPYKVGDWLDPPAAPGGLAAAPKRPLP